MVLTSGCFVCLGVVFQNFVNLSVVYDLTLFG